MGNRLKSKYIGDKVFYSTMIALLIPMVIQQGITSFVSLLDNVMVGRLGTESMSGVSIVNQLLFVGQITLFGGLSGASIFGAQFYGKNDIDGVRYAFRFKLILAVIVSVLTIAILGIFDDQLISVFLTDDGRGGDLAFTLSEAKTYLKIMFIGFVAFAFSQTYTSTLREIGETVIPMISSGLAILINLSLNYILIFGNFGAPRLGVAGAAIATVISRYCELAFLIITSHTRQKRFPFLTGVYKSLHIPKILVKEIIKMGAPLMLNEMFWSLGNTLINQSYSTRGLTVVAATTISNTAWNLFCIIFFSMGGVASILVGQQLGAGKIDEAKRTASRLEFFSTSLHVIIGVIVILLSPYIPLIYNTTADVRELTSKLLIVCGCMLPLHSFVHLAYFTIRSGGKTIITFLFDCVFSWVVSLPVALLLSRFTSLPIQWVYFCVEATNVIKAVIGVLLLRSGIWANNIVADDKLDYKN